MHQLHYRLRVVVLIETENKIIIELINSNIFVYWNVNVQLKTKKIYFFLQLCCLWRCVRVSFCRFTIIKWNESLYEYDSQACFHTHTFLNLRDDFFQPSRVQLHLLLFANFLYVFLVWMAATWIYFVFFCTTKKNWLSHHCSLVWMFFSFFLQIYFGTDFGPIICDCCRDAPWWRR